jgi:ATP-dependent RNA helicase DHX8/PRP22
MADSDLYDLEFLSLVAKITQEIENHTGLHDKTLAEFVIDLHDKASSSLPAFRGKLKEVGADFPGSFIENVDRLILSMHPKHKKKYTKPANANGKGKVEDMNSILSDQEKQKRLFPGLALKDKDVPPAVSDDVFLEEIGDLVSGRKARPRPTEDERSPKRQRRSRSPYRRSSSPPRGRGYGDQGYEGRRGGGRNGGRPMLDDKPILFKIYNGKVSGMKDFGAFVTLEGVIGRVEG